MPFDHHLPEMTGVESILPIAMRDVVFTMGGKRLIEGLTVRIDPGPRTVIMGANGAGKSLVLRLLQGLIRPTAGQITWGARRNGIQPGRGIALVFQRPVLLRRSVAANLGHALKVYGVPPSERPAAIDRLLDLAQLRDLRRRPARVLSGGEQQRLSVVRALAADPEVLLLDEPTANLDPQSIEAVERLIDAAHGRGTKIVLVTHDPGQARRLADEVVFLHRGRITEHSLIDEFIDRPRSEAGRAYLQGRLFL